MKNILTGGLRVGVGIFLVSFGLNFIVGFLFPALNTEYESSGLFRPWSDPLMQLYFAYPFILGLVLSFIWDKVKLVVAGRTVLKRGLNFGLAYFLAATIPGMFITYSSFYVSPGLILSWTINGLLSGIVAGIILAKLSK